MWWLKHYNQHYSDSDYAICKVILTNCILCNITNVVFLNTGLRGENLGGKSYFSNMVMDFTFYCYSGIWLYYQEGSPTDHHTVIIDRIYMYGDKYYYKDLLFGFKSGILVLLPEQSVINMMFLISNSQFQSMGQQIIYIQSG